MLPGDSHLGMCCRQRLCMCVGRARLSGQGYLGLHDPMVHKHDATVLSISSADFITI